MDKITLKEIAKIADCSIKTVSRALNDYPDINIDTKKKILKIVKDNNYTPNLIAKSLRSKKSYVVGYIISETMNEFFWNVAFAIEKELRKHNYSILTSFSDNNPELEAEALKLLVSRQVDGIILAAIGKRYKYVKEIIEQLKIPYVIVDSKIEGLKGNFVLHDNRNGAFLLTEHLIKHGYENIACIAGDTEEFTGKERLQGYLDALKKYDIPFNKELVRISNWKIRGGYDSTMNLFEDSKIKPRAIFISNSVMAMGTVKALREMKLSIPEEVALVSFDNLSFIESMSVPLTTLEKIDNKIGETAARMIYEKIIEKDNKKIEEIHIKAGLVVRESCGCNERMT
ncbi:MAG: LacI family DNA-binding transcriptional regulator [Actinomycetota bacterium]|nr:LacI family DNA-binding transcriptional regulator [Actinomycetota bacterium]